MKKRNDAYDKGYQQAAKEIDTKEVFASLLFCFDIAKTANTLSLAVLGTNLLFYYASCLIALSLISRR